MNASLDNHMNINTASVYESLNADVTPEQEAAMEELDRARKARDYEVQIALLSNNTPLGLVQQTAEAVIAAEKLAPGFNIFFLDAMQRRDFNLIGRLIDTAIQNYRHDLAAIEVGLKRPAFLQDQAE